MRTHAHAHAHTHTHTHTQPHTTHTKSTTSPTRYIPSRSRCFLLPPPNYAACVCVKHAVSNFSMSVVGRGVAPQTLSGDTRVLSNPDYWQLQLFIKQQRPLLLYYYCKPEEPSQSWLRLETLSYFWGKGAPLLLVKGQRSMRVICLREIKTWKKFKISSLEWEGLSSFWVLLRTDR